METVGHTMGSKFKQSAYLMCLLDVGAHIEKLSQNFRTKSQAHNLHWLLYMCTIYFLPVTTLLITSDYQLPTLSVVRHGSPRPSKVLNYASLHRSGDGVSRQSNRNVTTHYNCTRSAWVQGRCASITIQRCICILVVVLEHQHHIAASLSCWCQWLQSFPLQSIIGMFKVCPGRIDPRWEQK
jgi:hypothetical protein